MLVSLSRCRSARRVLGSLALTAIVGTGVLAGMHSDGPAPAYAAGCGDVGALIIDTSTMKQWWADMPDCPNDCTDAEIQLAGGGGYMSACAGPNSNRLSWQVDILSCAPSGPASLNVGTVKLYRYNVLLDTEYIVASGVSDLTAIGTYSSLYLPTRVVVDVDESAYPNLQIRDIFASVFCPN